VRKGFFLVFEFLLAWLLFFSVYAASSFTPHSSLSDYPLPELVCFDLLSVWLLDEDDLPSVARELLPLSTFSFSRQPIFSQKSHSYSCFAQRLRNNVRETQYILIEW
jgi:hypothetical protein